MLNLFYCDNGVGFAPNPNIYYRTKRWSDFSLYTDENSSEVTTISELFGFYEFIFGVIPMLSSSSASSCRLWTFSFLYAFLR